MADNGDLVMDILLVEDNAGDIRMTQEALAHSELQHRLHVVTDGESALDYLRGNHQYADVPRPNLVLLDLNLPRMNGREVLVEIKSDARLRHIPVVVLSTSTSTEDIQQSYELHANCFISKPMDFIRFVDVIRAIEGFWLNIVRLPLTLNDRRGM